MSRGRIALLATLALSACGGPAELAAEPTAGSETEAETETETETATDADDVDWPALAATSHAWTVTSPGRSWSGGGTVLQLIRPVDLAAPADCAPPAAAGIPRVRGEPVTVGPSPPFPAEAVTRVLRRTEAVTSCASCVDGTDVLELWVSPAGAVERAEPRARTHADDGRTACLARALLTVRLPESSRGPVRVVVPVRVRATPAAGPAR